MKKNQLKSQFKEMNGKLKEVAGKVVGIRAPGHEETVRNARGTIETAYANVQNEYKKLG